MPRKSELPDTLAQLSEYQAFVIRNRRWEWDKQELLKRVDRALAFQPEAAPSITSAAGAGCRTAC
jgi:hypothetical protein